jgi:hypothetical protein
MIMVNCVAPKAEAGEFFSDLLGVIFKVFTIPIQIQVFCPNNPTFRKNTPFRQKEWEEEEERERNKYKPPSPVHYYVPIPDPKEEQRKKENIKRVQNAWDSVKDILARQQKKIEEQEEEIKKNQREQKQTNNNVKNHVEELGDRTRNLQRRIDGIEKENDLRRIREKEEERREKLHNWLRRQSDNRETFRVNDYEIFAVSSDGVVYIKNREWLNRKEPTPTPMSASNPVSVSSVLKLIFEKSANSLAVTIGNNWIENRYRDSLGKPNPLTANIFRRENIFKAGWGACIGIGIGVVGFYWTIWQPVVVIIQIVGVGAAGVLYRYGRIKW